ncbi:ABZJ_00895 family protein [Microbulbifer sp. TRSA007]|uniref:ABZJ_00895 family protein n=1 Tax=Microbulbifer sp. TRSA007 TaxID=3243384 RepID=UPI00403A4893
MSIRGVLTRFTLTYITLIFIVGFTLNYFGVDSNSGVNFGILLGTIFWVCSSFANKNRRYFNKSEKTRVVIGLIAINMLIQAIFGAIALSESGHEVSGSVLLFSVAIIGAIHAVAIYFFVGFAKKTLIKQGIIES